MRAVTVLLICTFALYTKQQTTIDPIFLANLTAGQAACAQEFGVKIADAMKVWTNPTYPDDNHALKCYYNCMCKRLGIIDNGKYDNSDMMNFFAHYDSPTELKEIQDECKDTPPQADECEFAYQIYKCISEAQLDK